MGLSHTCNIKTQGNVCFVHFVLFGQIWNNILGQNNFYLNSIKDIAKCASCAVTA